MNGWHYLTCLWPGLAEVWWRGRLASLPAAVSFALAVNLLLVTRFLYPQWLTGTLVRLACWVGVAAWLFWVVRSIKELPELIEPRKASDLPDPFPEARAAYLAGQWAEAEALLADVLGVEPRDPPALLLLSGVYRHTGRLEAAAEVLQQLARLESADAWWLEREAEQRRLGRATAAQTADEAQASDDETGAAEENAENRSTAAEMTANREVTA